MSTTSWAATALVAALVAAPLGADAQQTGNKSGDSNTGTMIQQSIRGVIAGVTAAGEMTVDTRTQRVQAAEMNFLTIVGSPMNDGSASHEKDRDKAKDAERSKNSAASSRHNVYVLWLTPQSELCDAATFSEARNDKEKGNSGAPGRAKTLLSDPSAFSKVEVGDRVEVKFAKREFAASDPNAQSVRKHGRDRTYYGDIVSIRILSEPTPERHDAAKPVSRDDDKDKVKK